MKHIISYTREKVNIYRVGIIYISKGLHASPEKEMEASMACKFYTISIILVLVLTIFHKGAYLSFKSIFHKALNLFCEITLKSFLGTDQY